MKYSLDNNILSVFPEGRIDTEVSSCIEAEINEICKNNPHSSLILDASNLNYIASSGLRIILKIAKNEKEFSIVNVAPKIYNVFEMTGFNKIIKISKALRKIDLEKCDRLGFGGNGAVYRISEDEIVKVNYNADTSMKLEQEMLKAKEAFLLGVPTAISFDMVDCGNGKLGVVYETIKSMTLGETMEKEPDRIEELTEKYIGQLNALHSIHTDNPVFGNTKEDFRKQAEASAKYLTEEEGELLNQIIEALPDGDRLVHCDSHPKNLMIKNGEMFWIDMEQMSAGHPLYDLISIAVVLLGMSTEEMATNIAGMSRQNIAILKDSFIRQYFKTDDPVMLSRYESMLNSLRLIRTVFAIGFTTPRSEKFRPAIIDMARKHFFPNVPGIVSGIKYLTSVIQ